MANKQRGEVSFEADGNTWTMKIGTNAMCELEEHTGQGIGEIGVLLSDTKKSSMKLMRTVFRASLASKHPDITEKEVGDLIDEVGMTKAAQLISEAFSLAFPQAKKKAGESNPPQGATNE